MFLSERETKWDLGIIISAELANVICFHGHGNVAKANRDETAAGLLAESMSC